MRKKRRGQLSQDYRRASKAFPVSSIPPNVEPMCSALGHQPSHQWLQPGSPKLDDVASRSPLSRSLPHNPPALLPSPFLAPRRPYKKVQSCDSLMPNPGAGSWRLFLGTLSHPASSGSRLSPTPRAGFTDCSTTLPPHGPRRCPRAAEICRGQTYLTRPTHGLLCAMCRTSMASSFRHATQC